MTTFSGADPEALRGWGRELRTAAAQLEDVRRRLSGEVTCMAWCGPDRDRFADDWHAQFAPALGAVAHAVSGAAADADTHAAQQEAASEAGRYGNPAGELSARYESRGDIATVSTGRGDPGGVSYGTYQLATSRGTPAAFVTWAEEHYPDAHERLVDLTPGTPEFGDAWRELAAADAEGFEQAQHDFIVATHYRPGVDRIAAAVPDFTLAGRDDVVADVVWSTTVQHGAAGAAQVFSNALDGVDVAEMSDVDLVRAVYAERGRDDGRAYFPSSSAAVRRGVVARFGNEEADALAALGVDP